MKEPEKKRYVAGFLFSAGMEYVLLIEKRRPDWQKGLLNAIGGKIEQDETSSEAMTREFKEETGLLVKDWEFLCSYKDLRGWDIDFYYFVDKKNRLFWSARSKTDEKVVPKQIYNPPLKGTIPNLVWLIPMALECVKNNNRIYKIEEGGI